MHAPLGANYMRLHPLREPSSKIDGGLELSHRGTCDAVQDHIHPEHWFLVEALNIYLNILEDSFVS